MIDVHHSGPTNSTPFTNCCGVAICDDQAFCPSCKAEVYPGKDVAPGIRHHARFRSAHGRSEQRGYGQFPTRNS